MARGLFGTISEGYRIGADSLWVWLGWTSWLLKPVGFVWVLPMSMLLRVIAWGLYVLVVFDVLAAFVDGIRGGLLGAADRIAEGMVARRLWYLFSPLLIVPLMPFIVLAGLLPKLGIAHLLPSDHDDGYHPHPDGRYFAAAAARFRRLLSASWDGMWGHGLLFIPLSLPVGAVMIAVSLSGTVLFGILSVLDLLSVLVNALRRMVSASVHSLAWRSRDGLFSAVINPILMIVLLPVFVLILLIPKISTVDQQA